MTFTFYTHHADPKQYGSFNSVALWVGTAPLGVWGARIEEEAQRRRDARVVTQKRTLKSGAVKTYTQERERLPVSRETALEQLNRGISNPTKSYLNKHPWLQQDTPRLTSFFERRVAIEELLKGLQPRGPWTIPIRWSIEHMPLFRTGNPHLDLAPFGTYMDSWRCAFDSESVMPNSSDYEYPEKTTDMTRAENIITNFLLSALERAGHTVVRNY